MGRILKYNCTLLKSHLTLNTLWVAVITLTIFFNMNFISYCATLDTYYNDEIEEEISDGVTHIYSKRLTNVGIIDTNIIKIDLSNDNINFENLDNDEETGKKTKLSDLVKQRKNVVSAINGDFFEMALSPSFPLGITVNDGELENFSSGEYYNYYSNSLATLLIDEDNNLLIDYFKFPVTFSNKKDTLYVSYVNKLADSEATIYLSGKYFNSSNVIDERLPSAHKIVVRNDRITKIVEPGESVEINKNEYVIFLPVNFNRIENFEVGDKVELNIDSDALKDTVTAIGGAGRILKNGEVINDGYVITSRTCRSFVGFNDDFMYIGVVGGRTKTNVGVTHDELATILKAYGIKEAMHLDGGGSSEIIAKAKYNSKLSILNNVTTERAIINSLLITNKSSSSKMIGINLEFENDKLIKNMPVSYNVYGYNKNQTEIEIDIDDVIIECEEAIIDTKKNTICFSEDGRYEVIAKYKTFETKMLIDVYDSVTEIIILPDPINLEVDGEQELTVYALTEEKYKIKLDSKDLDYIVEPHSLAKVKDGKIIGLNEGAGTIGVTFDGLEAYSIVTVGFEEKTIEDFSYNILKAVSYPDTVKSEVSTKMGKLEIEYSFEKSDVTQAAYAMFTNEVKIPSNATSIMLDLKGDRSNNELKVKLVDDNKTAYNITLCGNINHKNTKKFQAELPTTYSGNLYVERIYVVSLKQDESIESEVTIDNLKYIVPYDSKSIESKKSITREVKSKDSTISKIVDDTIVFFNNKRQNTLHSNYIEHKINNIKDNLQNVNFVLATNTKNIEGKLSYGLFEGKDINSAFVVSLSTIEGSTYAKDPYQYVRLENMLKENSTKDIKNVIITLDGNLTNGNYVLDKAMLEYVLNKHYKENRVNFYVVSYTSSKTTEKVSNGIRYINICDNLNDANSKNILVFKSDGENLSYNLISLADVLSVKEEEVNEE